MEGARYFFGGEYLKYDKLMKKHYYTREEYAGIDVDAFMQATLREKFYVIFHANNVIFWVIHFLKDEEFCDYFFDNLSEPVIFKRSEESRLIDDFYLKDGANECDVLEEVRGAYKILFSTDFFMFIRKVTEGGAPLDFVQSWRRFFKENAFFLQGVENTVPEAVVEYCRAHCLCENLYLRMAYISILNPVRAEQIDLKFNSVLLNKGETLDEYFMGIVESYFALLKDEQSTSQIKEWVLDELLLLKAHIARYFPQDEIKEALKAIEVIESGEFKADVLSVLPFGFWNPAGDPSEGSSAGAAQSCGAGTEASLRFGASS